MKKEKKKLIEFKIINVIKALKNKLNNKKNENKKNEANANKKENARAIENQNTQNVLKNPLIAFTLISNASFL